jgi:CelD/BcsL family acetyltransferase involved in cellulose biosynthesis
MRVGYYLSWFFWSGITHATLDIDQSARQRSLFGVPLYLIRRAGVSAIRAVGAGVIGNMTGAVERALNVAFAAGYATRIWQAPRSPRRSAEIIEASGGGPR